jgi:hypothetical protein
MRGNALSTGSKTEAGKQSARCNAIRHGLAAETVIGVLENAEMIRTSRQPSLRHCNGQLAVELIQSMSLDG